MIAIFSLDYSKMHIATMIAIFSLDDRLIAYHLN